MGKKKQEEHVIKEATVDTDLWRTAMFGMNDSLRKIVEDASAGSDESGVVFDINAKDASGATPLIYAARAGHVETIQYLVDNGGDVSEAGYGGLLPLHHAINHMREPTCTLLLDLDANPNAGDEHGATALHFAAMAGALNARFPGARVAARAGRDVVRRGARRAGASGNTALHYAAMIGFPTFVNALLKNGASVKLTNGKRQIPADVAADGDIAALLKKSATA
ncbi:hypothetical protein JL722_833 [Aureococcus anophagefferens]|nr:hypothetical protein JL722_833 [Aureococcus anophagefferens]